MGRPHGPGARRARAAPHRRRARSGRRGSDRSSRPRLAVLRARLPRPRWRPRPVVRFTPPRRHRTATPREKSTGPGLASAGGSSSLSIPWSQHRQKPCQFSGGEGIRTPGPLARSPVFKTGALDHSATPPFVSSMSAGSPRPSLTPVGVGFCRTLVPVISPHRTLCLACAPAGLGSYAIGPIRHGCSWDHRSTSSG